MARIQSTAASSGVNPYEFPRNPAEYDGQDSFDAASIDILHGAPAWHKKKWDSRPRSLTWYNVGAVTTANPATDSRMVTTMRAWVGTVRYFNFQNLARINTNWPNNTNWNKARVINLVAQVRKGAGNLRYDTVELVLQPEN
jgi:hypothetical protein